MTSEERRQELALGLLGSHYADLGPVQRSVVDLIAAETPTGLTPVLADGRTGWDQLADRMAEVGGSWSFLGGFTVAMTLWIGANLILAGWSRAFDPYPFIFLNLVLSTLAAVQAPVILMSQNRQAARDRQAAEHDYRVNLRAELEIMRLHDRLQLSERQLERIAAAVAVLPSQASVAAGEHDAAQC